MSIIFGFVRVSIQKILRFCTWGSTFETRPNLVFRVTRGTLIYLQAPGCVTVTKRPEILKVSSSAVILFFRDRKNIKISAI